MALLPVPGRKRPARASLGIEVRTYNETSTRKLGSSLGNENAWLDSLLWSPVQVALDFYQSKNRLDAEHGAAFGLYYVDIRFRLVAHDFPSYRYNLFTGVFCSDVDNPASHDPY